MNRPQRIEPGPGQESVWDDPRPPALDPTDSVIRIEHGGWITSKVVGPFKGGAGSWGW